ncbi:MAG TPA: hypothetical protein VG839_06430 [Asticcacaulis sp.]|nr:hypothetical protein [Asticcacaulis sp.]
MSVPINLYTSVFERLTGEWDEFGRFDIVSVLSSDGALMVEIDGDRGSGVVILPGFYGYRVYDRNDLYRYFQEHGGFVENSGIPGAGLYVSQQSEHLNWARQARGIGDLPVDAKNLLIVSSGGVVDIISTDDPIFRLGSI